MITEQVNDEPKIKILVVDDQWTIRILNKRLLENSGYEVTASASGKEALQLLKNERFDLVLLDILMPDMNGKDVLREVRENHSWADLPVIMVTAKRKDDDIEEALSLGANDYMTKPFDLTALTNCIKKNLADTQD